MKICRFSFENRKNWGALINDLIHPFENFSFDYNFSDFIKSDNYVKRNEAVFLTPVSPSKIVCVGRNYAEHAAELGNAVPKEPLLFLKAPSSLITDGDAIAIPEQSNQVEHEGELAIVIKRNCKNLTENDNPFDYVFGYTCLNDVTARDLQRKDIQFTRAKSFDTFCPIGAFIETKLDVSDIRVTTKVNGLIKQEGRTSQMVFSVPYLIRYISNQMTLNEGDVIATGTPSGVSKLETGDVCEVEIEGIGNLKNPVV
jgi:2-keto-4-pentenoate hydratase/2-oxohepta-3-ene-1,7-dioic acid hydratase in catechol pathway